MAFTLTDTYIKHLRESVSDIQGARSMLPEGYDIWSLFDELQDKFNDTSGHDHSASSQNSKQLSSAGLATNAVTTAKITDSSVTEAKLGSATTSGITTGAVVCKKMATAQLEALLDTSTNNLFAVKASDVILCIKLWIQTAAGGAATAVTAGPDATARTAGADVDGILKAGDAQATGVQSSDDVAGTYMGALQAFGTFTADADGYITITSSVDQSSSNFVGECTMFYIPA